jgi:hypothetical protein
MSTVVSDTTTEAVQPRPALPPRTRAARVVRVNRVIIGLIGLILLLAGVAGLLAGFGVFGSTLEDEAVLSGRVDRFTERQDWFWPALSALTTILALLALWWLIAQLRTDRLRGIDLRPSGRDGQTYLDGDAITDAIEDEVESYRGVSRTRARLSGKRTAPRLTLVVTLDGRVGVGEIRHRVEEQALDHARHALETDWLPTRVDLTLPPAAQRNVR